MMSVQPAAEAKKAGRCQLGPTPDSQSTGPYRKRRLRPGEVTLKDVDVSYVSQESSKKEIEALQGGGLKAG